MSAFVHKGRKIAETVDTPVRSIVTQAEFDALPAEQQNKGLYVIDDGKASSGPGEEVYSTEETRISTWIDGKPLYRKCFNVTSPNALGTAGAVLSLDEAIRCVNISGLVYTLDGSILPVNFAHPTASVSCWQYYSDTVYGNSIRMRITTEIQKSVPVFLVLEYTKTTD